MWHASKDHELRQLVDTFFSFYKHYGTLCFPDEKNPIDTLNIKTLEKLSSFKKESQEKGDQAYLFNRAFHKSLRERIREIQALRNRYLPPAKPASYHIPKDITCAFYGSITSDELIALSRQGYSLDLAWLDAIKNMSHDSQIQQFMVSGDFAKTLAHIESNEPHLIETISAFYASLSIHQKIYFCKCDTRRYQYALGNYLSGSDLFEHFRAAKSITEKQFNGLDKTLASDVIAHLMQIPSVLDSIESFRFSSDTNMETYVNVMKHMPKHELLRRLPNMILSHYYLDLTLKALTPEEQTVFLINSSGLLSFLHDHYPSTDIRPYLNMISESSRSTLVDDILSRTQSLDVTVLLETIPGKDLYVRLSRISITKSIWKNQLNNIAYALNRITDAEDHAKLAVYFIENASFTHIGAQIIRQHGTETMIREIFRSQKALASYTMMKEQTQGMYLYRSIEDTLSSHHASSVRMKRD